MGMVAAYVHNFLIKFLFIWLFSLRVSLRNANLQAKANMRKAAQEEVTYFYYLYFLTLYGLQFNLYN